MASSYQTKKVSAKTKSFEFPNQSNSQRQLKTISNTTKSPSSIVFTSPQNNSVIQKSQDPMQKWLAMKRLGSYGSRNVAQNSENFGDLVPEKSVDAQNKPSISNTRNHHRENLPLTTARNPSESESSSSRFQANQNNVSVTSGQTAIESSSPSDSNPVVSSNSNNFPQASTSKNPTIRQLKVDMAAGATIASPAFWSDTQAGNKQVEKTLLYI